MSALACEGLTLRLGGEAVLRGASLRLEPGHLGLLTGPTGSGKSALLKLFLGLRPRASRVELEGTVNLLGQDALRTPTPRLARRAGLVFQDAAHQLTQADVAAELAFRPENLGLAPRDVEDRVEEALRRFGLGALRDRPLHALSGGEAKRVALAAVLAAEPEALLLDEPLGGLDAGWRARVLQDLRREARGRATLVVEHRAAELAALRPSTWAMRDGRPEPARPPMRTPRARVRARDVEDSPWPLVLAEGLGVRVGGRALLEGVDLALGPGVHLLRGPNGSGKTTLLRALAGLAKAEGRVRVAGLDPAREPAHRMVRVAGYVPQRAEEMFSAASVREELAFGPRCLGLDDPAWLGRLAGALGLGPLLDRHPWTLSGGEQQRLALGCALAHRPRVLLLDEPTVGLDAAGLARALDALGRAGQATCVLIASHDPEVVRAADRVLTLEQGRLRAARALEVAA